MEKLQMQNQNEKKDLNILNLITSEEKNDEILTIKYKINDLHKKYQSLKEDIKQINKKLK